ncbi:MAG: hypothetical protein RIK87_16155 [Fuerstiella sp.]
MEKKEIRSSAAGQPAQNDAALKLNREDAAANAASPPPRTHSPPTGGRRSPRTGLWRLLAVAAGLLPLVLLELTLRLLGVAAAPSDLHDGFGKVMPLFEAVEALPEGDLEATRAGDSTTVDTSPERVYRTSLAKERFFVSQQFPAVKPEREFRIFCLGGSTVQGRPYRPETSFATWLQLELTALDPSRTYRAVNCGGISYASYRLRPVLQEVLGHDPDLIILATGHNEFLEDRTYADLKTRSPARIQLERAAGSLRTVMVLRQLAGGAPRVEPTQDTPTVSEEVEARLDDSDGYASYHRDDQWRRRVCQQYGDSVAEMLQMCQRADVPVVLVRLGSNLRDCPPFKSEHRAGLSVDDEQQWQALFDQAAAVAPDDPAAALEIYRAAQLIDDQYPLLHFRMARCQDQLRNFDAAADGYRIALDGDICPLRMIRDLSRQLDELAQQHNIPLVDAEALIAAKAPNGIPGFESYVDHVHPNIGMHQRIGSAIAATLQDIGLIPSGSVSGPERRQILRAHMDSLGTAYFSNGRRRIGWLEGWARRHRLLEETRPADSRGTVAAAIRHVELHDFDEAGRYLQQAIHAEAEAAASLLIHAAEFFRQGRRLESGWLLDQLSREHSAAGPPEGIDVARLILAVDDGRPDDIRAVWTEHSPDQWQVLQKQAPAAWGSQMPDVVHDAATAVGSE